MTPFKMLAGAFAAATLMVVGCSKADDAGTTTPPADTPAPASELGESAGSPEGMLDEPAKTETPPATPGESPESGSSDQ